MKRLSLIFNYILDFVAPKKCCFCHNNDTISRIILNNQDNNVNTRDYNSDSVHACDYRNSNCNNSNVVFKMRDNIVNNYIGADANNDIEDFKKNNSCYCNDYLCSKCLSKLKLINQKTCCKKCGYPIDRNNFLDKAIFCPSCESRKKYFNIARSVVQYKMLARKTLLNMKYHFQTESLSFFAESMTNVYINDMSKADIICFVPVTNWKLFLKGFNHAGLIANAFYKNLMIKKRQRHCIDEFSSADRNNFGNNCCINSYCNDNYSISASNTGNLRKDNGNKMKSSINDKNKNIRNEKNIFNKFSKESILTIINILLDAVIVNHNNNTDEILIRDLFTKSAKTLQSKKLSRYERMLKKHNFVINSKYLSQFWKKQFTNKTFLVIDDIMTTGSTLNSISKILKDAFPTCKVECLTFARTMLY